MKISDHLDGLRAAYPACHLIGLVDMSAEIVLCVSSDEKHPQEKLDVLCTTAAELFTGRAGTDVEDGPEENSDPQFQDCLILSKTETSLFLRFCADPTEALVCVCRGEIDLDALRESAGAELVLIAAEQ